MLVLILSTLFLSVSPSPVCMGRGGTPVDFFFAYKLNGGTDYSYFDNTTRTLPKGPLVLTGDALDAMNSPLALTLTQLIENLNTYAHVTWNDEVPTPAGEEEPQHLNETIDTNGHTKGVLGAGTEGGFLLIHTLPKFPDLSTGEFTWGVASTLYAQNFLCLTLGTADIETAASALQFNGPKIYASAVPSPLTRTLPTLTALVAGSRRTGTTHVTLTTPGGDSFLQFAKSGSTGLDLYEDVVQAELEAGMAVETWRRSPFMESYCTPAHPYDSLNVQQVSFVDAAGGGVITRKYTQDHSKLAIVVGEPGPYGAGVACVGDMNRMASQWGRGGGTVCFLNNTMLHAGLSATFSEVDAC